MTTKTAIKLFRQYNEAWVAAMVFGSRRDERSKAKAEAAVNRTNALKAKIEAKMGPMWHNEYDHWKVVNGR